jgi:hypothetical protein
MGYLAAKDTGYISLQTSNYLITGINSNGVGAINPSTNNGITNLQAFSLAASTGKALDVKNNIAGNISRINQGSTNAVPISLETYYSNKPSKYQAEAIKYLMAWSRNRTIVMLFYMPNNTSDTLVYGQDNDFYYSQLKSMYDLLWDKNLGTNSYGATTYGSSRFTTGYSHGLVSYDACAIPIIIESVSFKEEAGINSIKVEVNGYVLESEGK